MSSFLSRSLLLAVAGLAPLCAADQTLVLWRYGKGTLDGRRATQDVPVTAGQLVAAGNNPIRLVLPDAQDSYFIFSPTAKAKFSTRDDGTGPSLVVEVVEGMVQSDIHGRGPWKDIHVVGATADVTVKGTLFLVERVSGEQDFVALMRGQVQVGRRNDVADEVARRRKEFDENVKNGPGGSGGGSGSSSDGNSGTRGVGGSGGSSPGTGNGGSGGGTNPGTGNGGSGGGTNPGTGGSGGTNPGTGNGGSGGGTNPGTGESGGTNPGASGGTGTGGSGGGTNPGTGGSGGTNPGASGGTGTGGSGGYGGSSGGSVTLNPGQCVTVNPGGWTPPSTIVDVPKIAPTKESQVPAKDQGLGGPGVNAPAISVNPPSGYILEVAKPTIPVQEIIKEIYVPIVNPPVVVVPTAFSVTSLPKPPPVP